MRRWGGRSRAYGAVETERLRLEPVALTDVDDLAEIFAVPEVFEFPLRRGLSRDETIAFVDRHVGQWEEHGFGLWTARLRGTTAVVGYLGLAVPDFLPEILPAVEVGWRLHPAHWGRGLATEGARAGLLQGFSTLGLDRIVSIVDVGNDRSTRLCDRLGMHLDRMVTKPRRGSRPEAEVYLYALDADTWRSSVPDVPGPDCLDRT